MAEIKVKLVGDNADFKKKLSEATEESREFARKTKESLSEIAGETGFGGIKAALIGGTAAAVAFGAAIVESLKGAVEEAINFEKIVASLKAGLSPAFAGQAQEITAWIESISGAMGTFEANASVFRQLTQGPGGMDPERAKRTLVDIQNAAAKTNVSVESLGEAIAEIQQTGEMPRGFFRHFPAMGALAIQLFGSLEAATPRKILEQLLPNVAPGGMFAPIRSQMGGTAAGSLADLDTQYKALSREVGEELLPAFKAFVSILKDFIGFIKGIAEFKLPGEGSPSEASIFGLGAADKSWADRLNRAGGHLENSAKDNAETARLLKEAMNPH